MGGALGKGTGHGWRGGKIHIGNPQRDDFAFAKYVFPPVIFYAGGTGTVDVAVKTATQVISPRPLLLTTYESEFYRIERYNIPHCLFFGKGSHG
jgi:hypothetical protein